MLVKIDKFNKNNTWVNPAHVESIEVYDTEDDCRIYINMANENGTLCSTTYNTYKEAVEAIDELAEKINAAQGFKPAAEAKTVMKYVEHGDEPSVDVYRCSHCKTGLQAYDWYKFCPYCGREIERWE